MSDAIFEREDNLIGRENRTILGEKTVAVFGLGGVGSFVVEALARAGIKKLLICDNDKVDITNINRQLYALHSTIGLYKTEVCKNRLKDINPDITVTEKPIYFCEQTLAEFDFNAYDYIVDAIDSVKSKILLIKTAKSAYKPIISCLGTGNKLDPTRFKIADIYKTEVCPLAKALRRELKKEGIDSVKTLFSTEPPISPIYGDKRTPASISFVPSSAGLIIAAEVIKDLLNSNTKID